MHDLDLILLKGEIFALKLFIPPVLSLLADQFQDREAFLKEIEKRALAEVKKTAPKFASRQTLREGFVQAGAGTISQVIQSARDPDTAPAPVLQ
jgi:hypothetical protein